MTGPADRPPFEVLELDHVVLRVRDQAASERFYTTVLGLALDHVNENGPAGPAPRRPSPDRPPAARSRTRPPRRPPGWITCACRSAAPISAGSPPGSASSGVAVEGDVVNRRGAFGDGSSLYIRDPDGYRIELKPRGEGHS